MRLSYPEPKSMFEFKMIEKAKENDSFRDMILYKKDVTKLFKKDIKERLNSKDPNHVIIQLTGDTGSGKSITGIISIALQLIDTKMDSKSICFIAEQVLERCKKLKKNTVVILDEQTLSVGVGSVREALELRNLEEITRKNKLSFVFISPTPRSHLTAHYNLELFLCDREKKINWLAINQDGTYLGYIKLKVDPEHPLWVEYDKEGGIKDQFIEKHLERKTGRLDYEKMAKSLKEDKRIEILVERNGFVKMDEMTYIIGRHYPSITGTERKELLTELKIVTPELFTRKK